MTTAVPPAATTAVPPAAAAETLAAWDQVLTDLEADVRSAVAGAPDDVVAHLAAWRPPQGLGPLPAELLERARELAAAYVRRTTELREEMAANRRQARATDAVPAARPVGVPAYLDVEA